VGEYYEEAKETITIGFLLPPYFCVIIFQDLTNPPQVQIPAEITGLWLIDGRIQEIDPGDTKYMILRK